MEGRRACRRMKKERSARHRRTGIPACISTISLTPAASIRHETYISPASAVVLFGVNLRPPFATSILIVAAEAKAKSVQK